MQNEIEALKRELDATKVKAWDSLSASSSQIEHLNNQLRSQSGLIDAVIYAVGLKVEEVKENPKLLLTLLTETFSAKVDENASD